mmetsp:Transcript_59439/g.137348  ORF Transcript_59439/g.137348 Transcript_59439/m.137348 type:complete len:161 (+) Transcript_59439:234-716(+)
MCGTCQEFQPTWQAVAEELHERLRLGSVNVDDEAGSLLAQRLHAFENGIPSVVVVFPEKYDVLVKAFTWDGVEPTPPAADVVAAVQAVLPVQPEPVPGEVWIVGGAAVLIVGLCSVDRCMGESKRQAGRCRWIRWLSKAAAVIVVLRVMMLPYLPLVPWW